MNKVIYEFYQQRTRLSDDCLKELKRIVDKEYERRLRAETNNAQLLGGAVNAAS